MLFCRLTEEQIEIYKEYLASRDVESILSGNMKVQELIIVLKTYISEMFHGLGVSPLF